MTRLTTQLLLILAVSWCAGATAQQPGQLVGIGIAISFDDKDSVWITQVVVGGPAARAGIQVNDELLAVDGRTVTDIPREELVNRIRGAAGSEVTLTVRARGDKPRKLTMKRTAIPLAENPPESAPRPAPPQQKGPQPQASQGSMKFTRVSVNDPGINNIEAVSFLIPAGWKTAGGVQWFPNYSILANLLMRITDPQTHAAIEFLPLQNFTWLTQMVVPMAPGTNYLGSILWQPIRDHQKQRGDSQDVQRIVPPALGIAGSHQPELERVHPRRGYV